MPTGIYEHRPSSKATKRKLSEMRKGANHPFFGRHHSKITKRKISERLKQLGIRPPSNKGRYLSKQHKRKVGVASRGEKNGRWKGDACVYVNISEGYKRRWVKCPKEFKEMAMADGYVLESRLVMARILGRPLTREEMVHHIDGDSLNNKKENLMLFKNKNEHVKYHWEIKNG